MEYTKEDLENVIKDLLNKRGRWIDIASDFAMSTYRAHQIADIYGEICQKGKDKDGN